jgi:hypothetical protein
MDRVIGEPGKRTASSRDEDFHLIGGGQLLNALKDVMNAIGEKHGSG